MTGGSAQKAKPYLETGLALFNFRSSFASSGKILREKLEAIPLRGRKCSPTFLLDGRVGSVAFMLDIL